MFAVLALLLGAPDFADAALMGCLRVATSFLVLFIVPREQSELSEAAPEVSEPMEEEARCDLDHHLDFSQ